MVKCFCSLLIALISSNVCYGQSEKPLLLQKPTLSKTHVVFAFAGDLWSVPRSGGDALRLTTGKGVESYPVFSPDGKQIAFSGQYDGNTDVFVIPAEGGVPKRLTWHPGPDEPICWTPDGKRILFRSSRNSPFGIARLYTVGMDGGMPEELPLPSGTEGSYSADGARLAYVPTQQWQRAWKRYAGGQTRPIWLADLSTLRIEKVPRVNSSDFDPMWAGNRVFFLSDRSGPISLFSYDTGSKKITQVITNDGLDIKSATLGPDAIVYEQFGSINLYSLASGKTQKLNVRISGDMPEVRPHYVNVANRIANAAISPTGARAVFEARGEILTVPAEKGDARNLTNTPGVMERDPAWSPDGKRIAYFSDESGEYALHIRNQNGMGDVKKIGLGDPPSFFYNPTWSPDSKKIAFSDKRLNLWYVDVEKGTPVKIDHSLYYSPLFSFVVSWSPDSRWIAYHRELKSHMDVICLYSLETGKSEQITDGLSDAKWPVFDKGGKYLYFAASTDAGLTPGWLNMTSMERPVTRSVYVVVLRKDLPSPLAPESDEEKPKEPEKKDEKTDKPKDGDAVKVDFDRIGQRILALPMPARNYTSLTAGKAGVLFIQEGPPIDTLFGGGPQTVQRFDLSKRKAEKFLDGAFGLIVSSDGEKALYRQGNRWAIVGTGAAPPPGSGTLNLAGLEVYSDPKTEWNQMYRETWRIERDFFYDPGLHGLDYKTISAKYTPYVNDIASRGDLNYLFEEMLGELTCGHVFIGGGDQPDVPAVRVGLLGADYKIESGRYRFARVYDGENWNPNARAPLTQPGVNVTAGEYLLEVNGRDVKATDEVHKYLEATAGKQTTLKVGPNPDGTGAREVTVVPIDSETGLRYLAWIEDNRRKVDQLSGGRIAYVHLPDTAQGGYANFNRYFFSQVGKEGAVIDERYNGGGLIADYIIDYLRRPLAGYFAAREGDDYTTPVGAIFGSKAMLINEYAGSGGDMMPWLFRDAKIGPLVGKRTWGGLVGMAGAAALMDGGSAGAPQSGFWNPNGTWDVENHGVDPDIEVENDPASVRDGHDLQLERAVSVVMEGLKKNPLPHHKKPAYPNYQKQKVARHE